MKEANELRKSASYTDIEEIVEHSNPDYPVGVYYVEPDKMYMGYVRWHWHEEIEINLIREGHAMFKIGDKTVTMYPGQAIFINSNVRHSITCEEGKCVILSLIFHPRFLFPNPGSQTHTNYVKPILEDSQMRYCIFRSGDMWNRGMLAYIEDIFSTNLTKEFGFELMTKSYLCQLWLHLLKKTNLEPVVHRTKVKQLSPDEIRIKDAISFIETHYSEPIMLEDIAESIHISKSECCRCFKRAVDMTPIEYLMKYRILQSAEMILKNDRSFTSISDLAYSVGFNNASYYNKLFKQYFGCTPSQYRNNSKTEHRDKLSPFGLSLSHI